VPLFLDVEASSLSPESYPIEVAWNFGDGSIESHLISPRGMPSWTDWDIKSEAIHGISRSDLVTNGESPLVVYERLSESLLNQAFYSDAPAFDENWLQKLSVSCTGSAAAFELKHVDDLLISMICPRRAGRVYGLIRIESLRQQARRQKPKRHRAALDVEFLIQLWRLALHESISQTR
jgi:hypothetical protein